jgi:cellulose synthase/poly-beta-1,6-N-acetylglucosamine synthase-like glycosyltransferase
VELDASVPFTAARARNIGFERLREVTPGLLYVQFIDGDCELIEDWPRLAVSFLESHADVGGVCGWRRELHSERSIYNWLCDREWNGGPTGQVLACGGDVMVRGIAFEAVGGYRNDLIAGEDPELCVRLRGGGWRIWRLDNEMTRHDAAMTHFGQWWRRAVRSGYAFAQGAYLHGTRPERHSVWESRRAWFLGAGLPLACLIISLALPPWGLAAWLVYPVHMLQKVVRSRGPLGDRTLVALFDVLVLFPQSWGQIKFLRDRLLGRQAGLIEYK